MYITTCEVDHQSKLEAPNSKPVHWDGPEGWDGEGGGWEVQDGGHVFTHG